MKVAIRREEINKKETKKREEEEEEARSIQFLLSCWEDEMNRNISVCLYVCVCKAIHVYRRQDHSFNLKLIYCIHSRNCKLYVAVRLCIGNFIQM